MLNFSKSLSLLKYLFAGLTVLAWILMPMAFAKSLTPNLIVNPSVEDASGSDASLPANWTRGGWGTNSRIFGYENSGHTGGHSLKIQIDNYTNGDAKWMFAPLAVNAGTTYAYSNYYKSSVKTELDAQYTDTGGNVSYAFLKSVPSSTDWAQINTSFTVPANVTKITIWHIIYSAGWLQTDDYSLTQSDNTPTVSITAPSANSTLSGTQTLRANAADDYGIGSVQFQLDGSNIGSAIAAQPYDFDWNTTGVTDGPHTLTAVATDTSGQNATSVPIQIIINNQTGTPPSDNLVPNPSVEKVNAANSKLPQNWNTSRWGTNTTTFSYLSSSSHTGKRSIKANITSYTNGAAYWYFSPQPITPGQQYDFTDYYKSNVITEIDAAFTLNDGSVKYVYIGSSYPSETNWTKFERQFTAPANAVSASFYHTIYSVGWLQTDDYSFAPYQTIGFNSPIVSLTFDDGWGNYFQNGLPILNKYGFKATDFIISGVLGSNGYMSANQVKQLYTAGHEIGSHTVSHRDTNHFLKS